MILGLDIVLIRGISFEKMVSMANLSFWLMFTRLHFDDLRAGSGVTVSIGETG
jgi:hypothetical protein